MLNYRNPLITGGIFLLFVMLGFLLYQLSAVHGYRRGYDDGATLVRAQILNEISRDYEACVESYEAYANAAPNTNDPKEIVAVLDHAMSAGYCLSIRDLYDIALGQEASRS
jgi:hypothetical protein